MWRTLRRPRTGPAPRELATGVDGVTSALFEERLEWNLAEIARMVTSRECDGRSRYRFGALLRFLKAKTNGGARALHVARVRDQLVLRAMHDVIVSSASRQGIASLRAPSPLRALATAANIWRGVREPFVLRADIRAFYDSIHRARVVARASALVGEPHSVELLKNWDSGLRYREAFSTRASEDRPVSGLPQGLSLSSLLAELSFSEIDAEACARFRWFRYVDDILVVCDSEGEALEALDWLNERLGLEGLELSPGKTFVKSLAEGFTWLGLRHDESGSHLDPERTRRWLELFAKVRRRAGKQISSARDDDERRSIVGEFSRRVRDEISGKTSFRPAWYAMTVDEGHWKHFDRTLHALIRSVYRQARADPPCGRQLPSAHRQLAARRLRISAPSTADQGQCAKPPRFGDPSPTNGHADVDGAETSSERSEPT